MTRRLWPVGLVVCAAAGVVAAWLMVADLEELRALLRKAGGHPAPPPRGFMRRPFDVEKEGW